MAICDITIASVEGLELTLDSDTKVEVVNRGDEGRELLFRDAESPTVLLRQLLGLSLAREVFNELGRSLQDDAEPV